MKRKLNENLSASEIRLNVTLMKRDDPSADYNEMAHNIEMAGGVVSQDEDENGDMIMVINDVDAETVIDIVDMTLMDGYDDIYMIANSLSGMNYETEDMIEDIDYPEYDDVDEIDEFDYPAYDEVDEDDFDEYDEYELSEKRKRCCPGRHINEKLKAFNDKDQKKLDGIEVSVKDIIKDLGTSTIGAHEAREAFKKLKAENAKLRKIQKSEEDKFNLNDVAGAKKAIAQIKKADPDNKEIEKFQKSLTEKVNNHLKLGKSYLHENVKFAGKSFKDMNVFEIKALYDKILAEKAKLSAAIKNSLNESDFNAIKLKLQTKNQLLDLLDEELTYRVVRQRCLKHINEGVALNEDGGEITDEELANLFGPAQGEEENTDKPADNEEKTSDGESNNDESNNDESNNDETNDDNTEEDEEVELSRIEITLKSKEAAEDLKQACLDADIPEDAMEIESDEDEDSEDGETEEGEESEEDNSEENTEEDEESNDANESVYYDQIRKLLFEGEVPAEADNAEETPAEDANTEENAEETEDNTEDEGSEESGVKFVLTNTDYALQLAKVLEDQYGISKDEFQGMIGGEIIEEQSDESDESATEDGDDESKDSEGSEDSNDADVMDPSELFKGL